MLLATPVTAANTEQNYSQQLELMNSLNKSEMQLKFKEIETKLLERINELEQQNAMIQVRLESRESDLGNYLDVISWVSGIVIGFVGILFGIGAFILYRENQDVATKTQSQLDAWNEQTANIQITFDGWFNDAKVNYTRELDFMTRLMRLRNLLDQANPTEDEIYPEVSPLYADPQLEYLPIFRKILSLDLGAGIQRHTETAIAQIMTNQKVVK